MAIGIDGFNESLESTPIHDDTEKDKYDVNNYMVPSIHKHACVSYFDEWRTIIITNHDLHLQGSAKRGTLGCANPASWLPQAVGGGRVHATF